MNENVRLLLVSIYQFETLLCGTLRVVAISHLCPALGTVSSTLYHLLSVCWNNARNYMNYSAWPHVVQQEKTASLLHICLGFPQNSDKRLVLGAALFRGKCKTRTQGFPCLKEPFSNRKERWVAFLGHWLGSLPVRATDSFHFPETSIWYTYVIFHQVVLLARPLAVA